MGCPRIEAGPDSPAAGDVTMNSTACAEALGDEPLDAWPYDEFVPRTRLAPRRNGTPGSRDLWPVSSTAIRVANRLWSDALADYFLRRLLRRVPASNAPNTNAKVVGSGIDLNAMASNELGDALNRLRRPLLC